MKLAIQTSFYPEIHSKSLQMLFQVLKSYNWQKIEDEIVPEFKKKAKKFHSSKHPTSKCLYKKNSKNAMPEKPKKSIAKRILELFNFGKDEPFQAVHNPKGAGRKGNPTIAYIKAWLLAPFLYADSNAAEIETLLETNRDFYNACEFRFLPAQRTLEDFDQIMSEYGFWEKLKEIAYQENIEKSIIDESAEDTVNIDNVHIEAYSSPKKDSKECRECSFKNSCNYRASTDETAGWYIKGKGKCYWAHMVGVSQLAGSGAPLDVKVISGNAYEPDTMEPLLKKLKERKTLKIKHINTDGIFNTEPCREMVKEVYSEDAKLVANVNPGRQKDPKIKARGIKKVTKYGTVKCDAGFEMVCIGKDNTADSLIYGCPVYNKKARSILIHRGKEVPEGACKFKNLCCPNAENGRIFRLKQELVPKVDFDLPQPTLGHWIIHKLRTKIERLFGYLKKRMHMEDVFVRGLRRIEGHVQKYMALTHIVAWQLGRYPV